MLFVEYKAFTKEDFTITALPTAEYDNCTFTGCNFNASSPNGIVFTQCRFDDCNLSNIKTVATAFKEAAFINCKLLGVQFSTCDPFLFAVGFEGCYMQLASFYKMKLKGTRFINCPLGEADFTEADLTGAVFTDCDLRNAIFENTILEKADLCTAINYTIDPEINRIKKAKFSREGLPGLLYKYNIDID
ncbi:pentapeptide repeat-containing protein [Flavobacterium sp. RHBU_24]|uniref:pentapeptide repeat-containing protein n=1 Tax=Flavobacterium sp. RHBU_24 TaxID=3391185 RepID=UPI00398514CB